MEPAALQADCEQCKRHPEELEEALQRERERISQTLYDTVCQEITSLYFLACGLALRCEATSPEASGKILELADKMQCAGLDLGKFVASLREDQTSRSN